MDTIEHYQLRRRLGSGAFATVWLAHDAALDAEVAIKVLGDNWVGHPDIVRRFLDEARLLFRAEDPRVVDVFRLGELPTGQPWFAMEYADRGTLEQRLPADLAIADALGLIGEMARCVAGVHRLSAVHRDVKPGNFLIRSMSQGVDRPIPGLAPDERLMIGDLGLAKVLATSSGFTVAAGSPAYMAPEQASITADLSYAADVFSLGRCALEVLTGQSPDLTTAESGRQLTPSPKELRPDLPDHVADAIQTAMRPDPRERHQSVDEFLLALNPAPPAAHQSGPGSRPAANAGSGHSKRAFTGRRLGWAIAVLVMGAALATILLALRSDAVEGTPAWFEIPPGVDSVTVDVDPDQTSVVGSLDGDFTTVCRLFIEDAAAGGWTIVRDECEGAEALASASLGNESAVIAELSEGRVGWRFYA